MSVNTSTNNAARAAVAAAAAARRTSSGGSVTSVGSVRRPPNAFSNIFAVESNGSSGSSGSSSIHRATTAAEAEMVATASRRLAQRSRPAQPRAAPVAISSVGATPVANHAAPVAAPVANHAAPAAAPVANRAAPAAAPVANRAAPAAAPAAALQGREPTTVAGATGSDGRKYANLNEFLNAFVSKDKTKSDGAQLTQSECDGPKRRLIVPIAETATLNELFWKEVVLGVGAARRKQVSHLVEYPFTRNNPAAPGVLAVDLDIKIDLAVFRAHARRAGWADPGDVPPPTADSGGAVYLPHLICGRRHILPFVQAQMAELYRLLRYQDRDTVRVFVLQKKKAKRSGDASAAVGPNADVFSDGIHMFLSVALPMAQHCWMYERMLKWIEGHWMNPRSPHFLPGLTTDARQILDKNVYAANTSVLKYGARKGGDTLVYALTAMYEFQAYVSGEESTEEADFAPRDGGGGEEEEEASAGSPPDWLDRVLPHRETTTTAATNEEDGGDDDQDEAPPRRRRRADSLGGSVAVAADGSSSSSSTTFGPWRQTEEPVTSRTLHSLEKRWFHLLTVRAAHEDVLVRPVRLVAALQAFVERDGRRFARRQATAEELRAVGGLDAKAVHRAQLADFTPEALLGGIQTTDDVLRFMAIFRASISPADEETPLLLNFLFHLPEEFYAKGHYGERLKVGFALHSYSPKLLVAYLAFCAQREDFDFRTKVPMIIEKWRSMGGGAQAGGGGRTTFRSIPFWCRAAAPEAFDAIRVSTFETQIGLMLSTLTMGNVSSRKSATSGTDVDKARLLVRLAAGRFTCAALSRNSVWYEYRDHRWSEIEEGYSVRLMVADDLYDLCHAHVMRLHDAYVRLQDTEGAEAEATKLAAKRLEIALNVATSLKETKTIDNVFKEAKMRMFDPGFFRRLDDNGYLVCFTNGVYDLREHVLREGQPDDFISMCTGYDYVPLEQQPPERVAAYMAYLKSMFPDPRTLEYVLDWIAFGFVADATINQCMHLLTGTGKNGKSFLMLMLRRAHGQRASYLKTSFYTEKTGGMGRASEELYNTINCSFVFSEEFSEGDVLYDDQMKAAVGGVTEMEARPMYKPLRRFTPKASMVVATNHRPKVVGTDDGIWRRVRDLECIMYYTDDPDPRNPHQAKSRSAEQMAALLDDIYTVAASVSFARLKARAAAQVAKGEMGFGKLEPCPAVVRATAAYRMEQDLVAAFLDDKTKSVACATVVPQAEVVSVFQNWCATELGDPGAAKRKHNEMMQRMGKRYSKSAPNVKPKGWFNLRILYDDGEEQQQHQNGEEASAATSNRRQRASAFGDEEDEEDEEPVRRRARLEKVLDDLPEEEEEDM